MVLDDKPENILQEPKLTNVERDLNDCALNLALLGELEGARNLLCVLFRVGVTGYRGIISSALNFAWREAGGWPKGASEYEKPEEAFEGERQRHEREWGDVLVESRTYDRKGLEACLSGKEDEYADAEGGASAMAKGQRLVKALDISMLLHGSPLPRLAEDKGPSKKKGKPLEGQSVAKAGEGGAGRLRVSDLDKTSAEILNDIVARWRANQQVTYLARAERLWPFYARGVIADAMGISKEELKTKSDLLYDAFSKRLESGAAETSLPSKSMKELLEIGNANTCGGPSDSMWAEFDEDERPATLFRDPASDQEIDGAETRLGTQLPDDYKEFLRLTNGFGVGEVGIFTGVTTDPQLFPASDIQWNDSEYFQLPVELLDIPREIEELGPFETKRSGSLDWDTALPLFDQVLEIGTQDIDNLWLVKPELVRQAKEAYNQMYENGNERQKRIIVRAMESFVGSREAFDAMEWCCVKWSSGGAAMMVAYSSFRGYIERAVLGSMKDIIREN